MTKYILHGGGVHSNKAFQAKWFEFLKNEVLKNKTLLNVYFAVPECDLEARIEEDNQLENQYLQGINKQVADETNFIAQVSKSDVIFLKGGDSFQLIKKLSSFPNLKSYFVGKTIIGASAGACALSKFFYSNDEDRIGEGLGFIDACVICHYQPSKHIKIISKLSEYKDNNLCILLIPEGKHVTYYNTYSPD